MSELSSVCQIYSAWAKGTVLYTRWAARCGIGYPELMVLYSLKTETGLTQRQITEEIGLVKATVNTVIRNLKKRGFVILDPCRHDRREKLVLLTEQGKQIILLIPCWRLRSGFPEKSGTSAWNRQSEQWSFLISFLKKN